MFLRSTTTFVRVDGGWYVDVSAGVASVTSTVFLYYYILLCDVVSHNTSFRFRILRTIILVRPWCLFREICLYISPRIHRFNFHGYDQFQYCAGTRTALDDASVLRIVLGCTRPYHMVYSMYSLV